LWLRGPRAQTSTFSSIYTPGEFYGGSNPSALCYTCQASIITGSAPPSNTLESGASVNPMTGDFTTANALFRAPAIGSDLSLALAYDTQLAQADHTSGSGQSAGPFGYGWSSNFSSSLLTGYDGSGAKTATVNQGNGSEVTFTQSVNAGTWTGCTASPEYNGDYPTTNKFTLAGSSHQWCALQSVQGQLLDTPGTGYAYQSRGGQSVQDYAWNGQLSETTSNTAVTGSLTAGVFALYNVAGGTTTTPSGVHLAQPCPSSVTCTIIYANDGRDVVEVVNTGTGWVTSIIDPSGAQYTLSYDSGGNLLSVTKPLGTSTTSTWNYVYSTGAASPYNSDLVQIYDPDSSATTPASLSLGAAHSTTIGYGSLTSAGMVTSLVDGTGATTTYGYTSACATGQCVAVGQNQIATITYPTENLCPSGSTGCPTPASQSPVETDQYSSGLETSTTLGLPSNALENETWSYGWNVGNGTANTSEVITYPKTLGAANSAGYVAPTATIITDPGGNVVSTTNALGDTYTSSYNDVGANNLNELLWSFPGPANSASTTPPVGASNFTYNTFGQVLTATDPAGSVTSYGYYANYSLACYEAPPSLHASLSSPPPGCTSSTGNDGGAVGSPVGATTYSYDSARNMVSTTIDAGDVGASADPQTTTSSFDTMGNRLWIIPAAGQSGAQSSSNLYATSTTYSPANLPLVVTSPGGVTNSNSYDPAQNVTSSSTSSTFATTNVFDADNRVCYSVTAATVQTGLTCASAAQAGSSATTFVPGSAITSTTTDGNGNTTSYYYGDLAYPASPTEVVDPLTTQKGFVAYDDYGNACSSGSVFTSFAASQCSSVSGDTAKSYNALNDATKVTDPIGNVTTNAYENASYPTTLTRSTNALGAATTYRYDADGRRITTVNPDGTAITTAYNVNGQVCSTAPTALTYPCGQGPSVAGVTLYTFNNAGERTLMSDQTGNPATPNLWGQNTTYAWTKGQLASITDAHAKTVSYLYNYAGQVACVAYPVSATSTCGTISAPATASSTNTISARTYDTVGRLGSVADWLGNSTTYSYGNANFPNAVTNIAYPASTGLTAAYGYDHAGNLTSLTAGANSDAWTYNADEQVATTTINGATSAPVSYNANHQITAAATLATSTTNDVYTVLANGEITADVQPTGPTISSTYNAGAELCTTSTAGSVGCGLTPTSGVAYTSTANGQRSSSTPYAGGVAGTVTHYAWNSYGQLCNIGPVTATCGSTPSGDTSYQYNGDGLRVTTATSTATTASTWDPVSGGSIPLNINDATTSGSTTTNTSYLYGNLLFGGTAPVEQITGTTATFFVTNPTGVQAVYGATGTLLERATYSPYGLQAVTSGSKVTPFGFQGSYSDATALIYLINRYYDPTTNLFLSIDPAVATTSQPYLFSNDSPLNATDPLGLIPGYFTGKVSLSATKKAYLKMLTSYLKSQIQSQLQPSNLFQNAGTLTKAVDTKVRRALSQSGGFLTSRTAMSLEESLNTGLTRFSSLAEGYGSLMIGYDDLSAHRGVVYAASDITTTAAFGVGGTLLCGGEIDVIGVLCGVVAGGIAHWLFGKAN
jgi:RHS repeat-associated protein